MLLFPPAEHFTHISFATKVTQEINFCERQDKTRKMYNNRNVSIFVYRAVERKDNEYVCNIQNNIPHYDLFRLVLYCYGFFSSFVA